MEWACHLHQSTDLNIYIMALLSTLSFSAQANHIGPGLSWTSGMANLKCWVARRRNRDQAIRQMGLPLCDLFPV